MSLAFALSVLLAAANGSVVVDQVPEQFVGTWEPDPELCEKDRSDLVLQIEPTRITYHESSGPLSAIVVRGRDELAVVAELTDEGESWLSSSKFRLTPDGKLVQHTDYGQEHARYRCTEGSTPVKRKDSASLHDLPLAVQAKLLELFHGEMPAPANGDYNPTDLGDGTPNRKLVFWHRRGHRYFVHYLHGGYAWHSHVVGIQLYGDKASPVFNVSFFRSFDSYESAREGMASMEFHSMEDSYNCPDGSDQRSEY